MRDDRARVEIAKAGNVHYVQRGSKGKDVGAVKHRKLLGVAGAAGALALIAFLGVAAASSS